jgi:hypothetical protein
VYSQPDPDGSKFILVAGFKSVFLIRIRIQVLNLPNNLVEVNEMKILPKCSATVFILIFFSLKKH